jgi:WD40 repeat protein
VVAGRAGGGQDDDVPDEAKGLPSKPGRARRPSRAPPFQFSLATLLVVVLFAGSVVSFCIRFHPWQLVKNPILSNLPGAGAPKEEDPAPAVPPRDERKDCRIEDGPNGSVCVLTRSAPAERRTGGTPVPRAEVRLEGHRDYLATVRFSPDREKVVTASWDGTARVWDAATGKELAVLTGHELRVNLAVFSPDGLRVATAGSDGTARVWNAGTGAQEFLLAGHEDQVLDAEFSPRGGMLLTRGGEGRARLWDTWLGWPEDQFRLRGEWGREARFSADGGRLFITFGTGEKHSWRRVRPEPLWGVVVLPEFWIAAALGGWLIWRSWRNRRMRKAAAGEGAPHAKP